MGWRALTANKLMPKRMVFANMRVSGVPGCYKQGLGWLGSQIHTFARTKDMPYARAIVRLAESGATGAD
jgi:hypothetical protein